MKEVVGLGAEQCLPRSLSDFWLGAVSRSADELLSGEAPTRTAAAGDDPKPGALALAALLRILEHRNRKQREFSVSQKRLGKHLTSYRIELALEEVHRNTDVKYEPATLSDILTNRSVKTWKV